MSKHPNFLNPENVAIAREIAGNCQDYYIINDAYAMAVLWDMSVWVCEITDSCQMSTWKMVQRIY